MSAQTMRELRVLSGAQSGARAKLPPGRYTLGADELCDIVLRGLPAESGNLIIEVGKQNLSIVSSDIGITFADGKPILTPYEMKGNEILRFLDTEILVSIEAADHAWPSTESILETIRRAKEEAEELQADAARQDLTEQNIPSTPLSAEENSDSVSTLDETHAIQLESDASSTNALSNANDPIRIDLDPLPAETTPIADAISDMPMPNARHGTAYRMLRFMVIIGGVTGAVAWWSNNPPDWLSLPASYASKPPRTNTENPHVSVNSIIQQLGLSDRVRVTSSADGTMTVAGHFPTERERQLLLHTIAGLPHRMEMLVYSDEGISSQIQRILQNQNLPLRVSNVEAGRLQMMAEGPIVQSQFTEASELLLREVKGLRSIDPLKMTSDDAIVGMQSLLDEYGLARSVKSVQEGNVLKLSGDLDSAEFEKWERLVKTFHQRFGEMVKFEANFNKVSQSLPFQILQVLDGPIPAVVTNDGTRIFEGGEYQGYRLAEVRNRQLVFTGRKNKVEISF